MMTSIRLGNILLLLFVLYLGTFSFVIAWPIENGVAVCTTTTSQTAPRTIADGDGGVIVYWRENRSGNYFLCTQRINSFGSTIWNPTGITLSTTTNRKDFRTMVTDGMGGAIIVWDELINGNYDLFAQRVNSNGSTLWNAGGLTISTATLSQSNPEAIADGSGGVFIVWVDSRNYSTSNDDIYGQRVNSDGSTLWTANGVPICTDPHGQQFPVLTSDSSGGIIVTWEEVTSVGYYGDIYAQRVDGNGNLQWTSRGVVICTSANTQEWQSIVSDGTNGAIIAWKDLRTSPGADLYAQRINSSGVSLWTLNGVGVCTVNYVGANDHLDMIADGNGGAILVWEDNRYASYPDVFAQRINAVGTLQWPVNGLAISTVQNYQVSPNITTDNLGGVYIAWGDSRNGFSDIYGQHINSTGSTLWSQNGLSICSASRDQVYPWMAPDDSGGAIIVWQDSRPVSQTDIYAQRVDGNGNTDFVPVELVQFEVTLPE